MRGEERERRKERRGEERRREERRGKKQKHLIVHYLNTCNGQNRVRYKAGRWEHNVGTYVGDRNAITASSLLPPRIVLAESQIQRPAELAIEPWNADIGHVLGILMVRKTSTLRPIFTLSFKDDLPPFFIILIIIHM